MKRSGSGVKEGIRIEREKVEKEEEEVMESGMRGGGGGWEGSDGGRKQD